MQGILVSFQHMAGKIRVLLSFYRALKRLAKRLFTVPRCQIGFCYYALLQLTIVSQLGCYHLFR
ncbi:MAG: hypothetical protein ACRYFV_07890 [Janthinobacterium lividum]